jgi:hypothetical protein
MSDITTRKCWCGGGAKVDTGPDGTAFGICLDSEYHDPIADGRPKVVSKIYIAGPMSGYPNNNYPLFNVAAALLRSYGFTVVNPAEYGAPSGGRVHYVDLIREDLRLMLDCHAVATLDHWWESAGARNEVTVAGMLKMPVRSVEEWTFKMNQMNAEETP